MLQNALFAAILLLAPTATATATAPAAVEPDATVVALTGTVTVVPLSGTPHGLSVGDGLLASDTVKTAKNATVDVRVRKNRVVWSLRGGLSKRLDQSLAWTSEPASGTDVLFAGVVDASRTSAGRHGESEAGQSSESLMKKRNNTSSASNAPPPPQPTPAGGKDQTRDADSAGASTADDAGAREARRVQERESRERQMMQERQQQEERAAAEAQRARAEKQQYEEASQRSARSKAGVPTPTARYLGADSSMGGSDKRSGGAGAGGGGAELAEADRAKAPAAPAPVARTAQWTVVDATGLDAAAVSKALEQLRKATDACGSPSSSVDLRFEIGGDGRVGEISILGAKGLDAKQLGCIQRILVGAKFPKKAGAVKAELTF